MLSSHALITKIRTIILFINTTSNCLGFGGTFSLPKPLIKIEDMLVYQSNPVGVELFSHVLQSLSLGLCYIISAQKPMSVK